MPRDPALVRPIAGALLLVALARCAPVDVLNATIPRRGLTIQHDIAYGDLPRETLDVYRPSTGADLPVIVFFYGGSWRTGKKSMYPFVAATLARQGAVVVVPDYRLYPQVTFPDFLRDNARAVAWAYRHRSQLGGSDAVFLMGHSAGAYNAAMLGLDPKWLAPEGLSPGDLAGVIGLAGPYDFLPITDPEIQPVFPAATPATQPITYASAGRPPLLLLAGTADTQVKPRNTRALAAKIDQAGGAATLRLYPGIGHIGLITAFAPIFQWRAPVLRDVLDFVRGHASFHPAEAVPKHAAPAF